MKKICTALPLILLLCLIITGCSSDIEGESISVSGDLAYYAEIGTDTIADKYKGEYIEVSGVVDYVFENLGTIYVGNTTNDNIRFSCDLADSDNAKSIKQGDLITVRGKCSSCLGSTVYLQKCEVKKSSNQAESENTTTSSETTDTSNTEPPHTHKFSAATCTDPMTCSCGATEGKANGHAWNDATCSKPKTCTVCGETSGSKASHTYYKGKCTYCGEKDPYYTSDVMVWIPQSGKKYHSHSGCSNMKNPSQVTKSEAEARGYTPCSKCY